MQTCAGCGIDTDRIYRLCPACVTETVRISCAAQGVPYHVEDPAILADVARVLRGHEAAA